MRRPAFAGNLAVTANITVQNFSDTFQNELPERRHDIDINRNISEINVLSMEIPLKHL
jgi:hypothetical protein